MTSAGRILIIPKGNWDASTTYEMLDLVFHSGASWIAKKTAVGIEPKAENADYWMKMCDGTDLTDIENRVKALEDKDTTQFAKQSDVASLNASVSNLNADMDNAEKDIANLNSSVANLNGIVSGLPTTFSNLEIVTHEGTNTYGPDNPTSVTCKTAPRLLIYLGHSSEYGQESATSFGNIYTQNLIICDFLTTEYTLNFGFKEANVTPLGVRYAKKSEDGKTISWYLADSGISNQNQLNSSGRTYYFLAIS